MYRRMVAWLQGRGVQSPFPVMGSGALESIAFCMCLLIKDRQLAASEIMDHTVTCLKAGPQTNCFPLYVVVLYLDCQSRTQGHSGPASETPENWSIETILYMVHHDPKSISSVCAEIF